MVGVAYLPGLIYVKRLASLVLGLILDAFAAGLSIDKAAKRFHLPVAEVRRILQDEVERCRDGEHLREVWALADS